MKLFGWEIRRPQNVAQISAAKAGRPVAPIPTYIRSPFGSEFSGLLPRKLDFELLRQFYVAIPELPKAVEILSGLMGFPEVVVGNDDKSPATTDLREWVNTVKFGDIGFGLRPWLAGHVGQALTWGFGVSEMVANATRTDVDRVWNYTSPSFGFRADSNGLLTAVQNQPGRGLVNLNPDMSIRTTYRPEGCDPNGTALFFSSGTFCQVYLDAVYAYRSSVRRSGIPTYHIHTALPKELHDPTGKLARQVVATNEAAWNEGRRSQVEDGLAQDFFTCSVGATDVKVIGGESAIPKIAEEKRPIVEEIITCTGIPPFMFGLSWSTTERMSTQQADVLIALLGSMRGLVEPGLTTILNMRRRLQGKRPAKLSFKWCDINLQDLKETAEAAYWDQQSRWIKQRVERQLWADGVRDQLDYAEEMTERRTVVRDFDEPPPPLASNTSEPASGSTSGGQTTPPARMENGNGRSDRENGHLHRLW